LAVVTEVTLKISSLKILIGQIVLARSLYSCGCEICARRVSLDFKKYCFHLTHLANHNETVLFQVVKQATGQCSETMTRKAWDVGAFVGQRARVKLVDVSSGGWGHINFDDLKGDMRCGPH